MYKNTFTLGNRLCYGFVGYSNKQILTWILKIEKQSFRKVSEELRNQSGLKGQDPYMDYMGLPIPFCLVAIKENKNGKANFKMALMEYMTFKKNGVSEKLKWYRI